jgi:hypothetical protein
MSYADMTEAGEDLIMKILPTYLFDNVLLHFVFKILQKTYKEKFEIHEMWSIT